MNDSPPVLLAFDDLTTTEAEELGRFFKNQTFSEGTVLYREEEEAPAFYIVRSGKVELVRKDETGEARMVDFLVQGDFFGEMALLDGRGWKATARVVESADLYFVARDSFERLTRRHPRLAVKVLALLARKLEQPDRLDSFVFDDNQLKANRVVALAAATAGMGRTFIGANVAEHMARLAFEEEAGPVCYLDLDFPFGNAGLYFGVESSDKHWMQLVEKLRSGLDAGDIKAEEHALRVDGNLYLFQPPRDLAIGGELFTSDVERLIGFLKAKFDRVVIDLPAGLSEICISAVRAADRVVVVSTYTIDAVSRLKRFLGFIDGIEGIAEHVSLILNRRGSSMDVRLPQHETIARRVLMTLENNSRVSRALKDGALFVKRHKRAGLTRSLQEIAQRLMGLEDSMSATAAFLASWLPFRQRGRGRNEFTLGIRGLGPGRTFFRRRRGRARLALAEALYLDGRFFRAFQELRRAVDDDPGLSKAYLLLGEIARALARRREAVTYYEAALRCEPGNLRAMVAYAVLQRRSELLNACRERLTEEIAEHPDWADLHCLYGNVCVASADAAGAIRCFTDALRINPGYAAALRGLGDLYVQQRKNTQAVEFYLKSLKANSGDLQALYALARLLRNLGIPGLAVRVFDGIISRCPHHGPAQQEVMLLREAIEHLDDEIRGFEAALAVNPDFSDTLCSLGEAYTRRGLFDKAVKCFKRALRFNPDMMSAKDSLVRVKTIKERIERGGGLPRA